MKSRPSEPARDTITTLIFSPFVLFGEVIAFISISTRSFVVKLLSPVIIIYFAGNLTFSVLIVSASIGLVGGVLNKDFPPYFVNPISSRANAIGTPPPSIYCEYIKIIPSEFLIESQIVAILPLYFPISLGENILPKFCNVTSLYLNSLLVRSL